MGIALSTEKSKEYKSMKDVLDYIASNYILTSDFTSLSKLYEEEYCNNLVVLTRDIIDRNFDDKEVTYLSQRLKGKEVVNEEKTDNVTFVTKSKLDRLSNVSKLKKKRMCQGIAKFYVKIAHVFSAIIMTINPVYTYKDDNGETIKTPLEQKDTIPKNARDRRISGEGLCYNRINQLSRGLDMANLPEKEAITLAPKICIDKTDLMDEPGIPELQTLYYDKYNYETGSFTEMKEETKKKYVRDVERFYKVFTGNDTLPETPISTFSDIKLKDYNKSPGCQGKTPQLKTKVSGSIQGSDLFSQYANTLREMMRKSDNVQRNLLGIINEIFTYDVDATTQKRLIRIQPNLTEPMLDDITKKTRNIIINYYLTCEEDFTACVKIYESIVESQILDTTMSQIDSLEETKVEMAAS